MTSLLLIAFMFCQTGQQVEKLLPWPGPDVEPQNMGARENAHKLLEARSIYIQTALPLEEATPPAWLTQRWPVAGPAEADLHIFILKQATSVEIPQPFASFRAALDKKPQPPPVIRPAMWYKMIVTDRDGKWVITAIALDKISDMWTDMQRQILDQPRWEAERAKKAHKEKKKVETQ